MFQINNLTIDLRVVRSLSSDHAIVHGLFMRGGDPICGWVTEHEHSHTAESLGWSIRHVEDIMRDLEREGLVELEERGPHGIALRGMSYDDKDWVRRRRPEEAVR